MYIIRKKKFLFLPLAYNDFCDDINSICQLGTFTGTICIQRIINAEVINRVKDFIERNAFASGENWMYVIDMQNIISYADHAFEYLRKISDAPILICNISRENMENIKEDLQYRYFEIDRSTVSVNVDLSKVYQQIEGEISGIYHDEVCNIVKWMTVRVKEEDIPNLKPLDSSGVYCNMYVNAKKLFLKPENYNFILYQMVKEVSIYRDEIDALVSSSRNGANLANLIGWLLNIKVIHCINLGPRFSLSTYKIRKDIRKNKKYLYIYDFMCLGTEVKVLNTILGVRDAQLIGGVGIANYIDLEDSGGQKSVLGKMKSLIDIKKAGIPYKIAGTKEEIKAKLVKEGDDYESNIQIV